MPLAKWVDCVSSGLSFRPTVGSTHPFNGPFSGTTQVSRYQKGKTNLDFTEARDSEWQWQQLGHMQVCTSLQTDHSSTPPLSFLQAGCPSYQQRQSTEGQLSSVGHIYLHSLSTLIVFAFRCKKSGTAPKSKSNGPTNLMWKFCEN